MRELKDEHDVLVKKVALEKQRQHYNALQDIHSHQAAAANTGFRQWCLRLRVIEAQNLPVCDHYVRDANLVGLADPYVAIHVNPHDPHHKEDGRKV